MTSKFNIKTLKIQIFNQILTDCTFNYLLNHTLTHTHTKSQTARHKINHTEHRFSLYSPKTERNDLQISQYSPRNQIFFINHFVKKTKKDTEIEILYFLPEEILAENEIFVIGIDVGVDGLRGFFF
jgi:hypothetical protein